MPAAVTRKKNLKPSLINKKSEKNHKWKKVINVQGTNFIYMFTERLLCLQNMYYFIISSTFYAVKYFIELFIRSFTTLTWNAGHVHMHSHTGAVIMQKFFKNCIYYKQIDVFKFSVHIFYKIIFCNGKR